VGIYLEGDDNNCLDLEEIVEAECLDCGYRHPLAACGNHQEVNCGRLDCPDHRHLNDIVVSSSLKVSRGRNKT
jgi:hypothetical protein